METRQEEVQRMWKSEELPGPSRDPGTLASALARFGYCVIERALDGGQLAVVQGRLMAQAAAERRLHDRKNPANPDPVSQWVNMLLNKGDAFLDLVRHELTLPLVEGVLGADYLISCLDAQILHPGAETMALHTDQWWMPAPAVPGAPAPPPSAIRRGDGTAADPAPSTRPINPAMVVNVMWMITDFSEENGATRIVPGSHLSGAQPDPAVPYPVASLPVTGSAGTAFAFDGRLWHGAGANRSQGSRYAITSVFCAPQCRPLENYTRGLRPEVAARLPPDILARLGFSAWSSYGHTGDPDARVSAPGEEATGELPAPDRMEP
jgi:hypothetical protein